MKIHVVFLKVTPADYDGGEHPIMAYKDLQEAITASNNLFLDECERNIQGAKFYNRNVKPMYLLDNGDGSYTMYYDKGGILMVVQTFIVSLDLI